MVLYMLIRLDDTKLSLFACMFAKIVDERNFYVTLLFTGIPIFIIIIYFY